MLRCEGASTYEGTNIKNINRTISNSVHMKHILSDEQAMYRHKDHCIGT